MKLRCKPGDLVVMTRCIAAPLLVDRIFTVTRLSASFVPGFGLSYWETDPPQIDPADGFRVLPWDGDLIPLRDQPGADETLSETWAGKPRELPADIIRELTGEATCQD